jgi:pimeloyl-ACP methyl ester carboxylesterase
MKYCVTQHGNRVAYTWVKQGKGIPLVLIHGFCEDHSVWTSLQPSLKPVSILLLDLPGLGQSELPHPPEMQSYAEAVKAVLDQEQIAQCVLVGHSMGGYAALEFAALWPERLAGLGLFHSHPFEDSEERKTARQRGIETLQAGKRDLYVAQLFPNLFAESFLKDNPDVLNALISNGKKQSPEGIIAALQSMLNRRDHQKTLREISCPVLFLLGQLDTLVPPEQALKAALLPTVSDLHLLPEAAHMAMFESLEESAEILNSFWDFCGHGSR